MPKTKETIVTNALTLFNEKGWRDVSMSEIAVVSGRSLSNVNYHFKNKEALINEVLKTLVIDIDALIFNNPDVLNQKAFTYLRLYLEFQLKFKFYFQDTYGLFSTYPSIKETFWEQGERAFMVLNNRIYLLIGKGYLKPEPPEVKGLYKSLSHQCWNHIQFLLQLFWFLDKEGDYVSYGLDSTYRILYPHLSALGKKDLFQNMKEELEIAQSNFKLS